MSDAIPRDKFEQDFGNTIPELHSGFIQRVEEDGELYCYALCLVGHISGDIHRAYKTNKATLKRIVDGLQKYLEEE